MLDKTIPFHSIIMRHPNRTAVSLPVLPQGFSVRFYQPKDEVAWADIQVAVGEFRDQESALKCYEHYWKHMEELQRRQLFIVEESTKRIVATATAWYTEKDGKQIGVVHGLSCLPEYQSKGLGKIAAAYLMHCFYQLMPDSCVWLDTQTWSYVAIGIYLEMGFVPQKKATFNEIKNEYDEAVDVLEGKMREDKFEMFINLAE